MSRESRGSGLVLGLFLTAAAITAGVAVVEGLSRMQAEEAVPAVLVGGDTIVAPAKPIAAEADVFRLSPAMMAVEPGDSLSRAAIPRTRHKYRVLRTYPGAPPTIPHGFTGDEFRSGSCNTCHERGGYSPRFNAYVPLTPHPQLSGCLDCHVANDLLTGVSLPSTDPGTICRQCHVPGAVRRQPTGMDWVSLAWPETSPGNEDRPPPVIPHDLQLKGNCLACHAGPATIPGLKTDHPDRANCRQCHLTEDPQAAVFRRPKVDGVGVGR